MVPVGGSIIYGTAKKDTATQWVNKSHPGRAPGGPTVDLFLTLVEMGETTLKGLVAKRKEHYGLLKEGLAEVMAKYGERVLDTPRNSISIACTLGNLPSSVDPTFIGSYLFSRHVSGCRVLKAAPPKAISGIEFSNYGCHSDEYPHLPFFTTAAAIGLRDEEIPIFMKRLDDCLSNFY